MCFLGLYIFFLFLFYLFWFVLYVVALSFRYLGLSMLVLFDFLACSMVLFILVYVKVKLRELKRPHE